ncbi:TetR/AcrR family transcriptional regulator [Microbacterium sp.]|uniref:TetR/AcrR family transcriptional regulator n=1 Tax=Microbacterium sp. TaxID=51671 RepID=UPI0035678E80
MASIGKRPYHHGDLRNALIDATLALVDEKGIDGFTMTDAARRAGVSGAAPYRHFADRNALVATASAEGFAALHQVLLAAVQASAGDPAAVAAELAAHYVKFAEASAARFALMFSSGIDKAAYPELMSAITQPQVLLEDAVRALPAVTGPAGKEASALWSIAHGVATLAVNGLLDVPEGRESRASDAAKDIVRTWLTGLNQTRAGRTMIPG